MVNVDRKCDQTSISLSLSLSLFLPLPTPPGPLHTLAQRGDEKVQRVALEALNRLVW